MKKIIIAIDGFSSTGKSTVAKQLASALNYIYVDTGAMYRAITLFAMQRGFISKESFQKSTFLDHLDDLKLDFKFNPDRGIAEIYLNKRLVESQIRNLDVSYHVSKIAAIPEVRQLLVKKQRAMGQKKGIVMDGRDIGTVVFPQADLKIFMNATAQKRAERRYRELHKKDEDVNYQAVLNNIQKRDHMDSTREDSPLKKAEDAVEIDNSNLSEKEQFDQLFKLARRQIEEKA